MAESLQHFYASSVSVNRVPDWHCGNISCFRALGSETMRWDKTTELEAKNLGDLDAWKNLF